MNVDPLNAAGSPDPRILAKLAVPVVRFVYRPDGRVRDYHAACKKAGLKTLVTLAGESFGSRGTPETVGRALDDCRGLDYFQFGNEPDAGWPDPYDKRKAEQVSSWVMEAEEYLAFHNACAGAARARGFRGLILTAGLSSGRPDWFSPIASSLSFDVTMVHPYDKDAEQARALLRQYKQALGWDRIGVSEWNRGAAEIPAFKQMLSEEAEFECFFCWGDGQVVPFGVLDINGKPKAEYNAMFGRWDIPTVNGGPVTYWNSWSDNSFHVSIGYGIYKALVQRNYVPVTPEKGGVCWAKNDAGDLRKLEYQGDLNVVIVTYADGVVA